MIEQQPPCPFDILVPNGRALLNIRTDGSYTLADDLTLDEARRVIDTLVSMRAPAAPSIGMEAVLDAARRLLKETDLTYSDHHGDDTPMTACIGCGAVGWGFPEHEDKCPAEALRRALAAAADARPRDGE